MQVSPASLVAYISLGTFLVLSLAFLAPHLARLVSAVCKRRSHEDCDWADTALDGSYKRHFGGPPPAELDNTDLAPACGPDPSRQVSWSTYKFLGSLRPQDLSPVALEALTAAVRKQAEARLSRPVRLALSVYEGCVMLRLSAWSPSELDLGAAAGGGGWEDVTDDAELDASDLLSMLPPDLRARVSAAVSESNVEPLWNIAQVDPVVELPGERFLKGGATAGVKVCLAITKSDRSLPIQADAPAGPDSVTWLQTLSSRYRPVAWEAHRTAQCPVGPTEWSLGTDGAVRVTFNVQVGPPDVQGRGRNSGVGASLLIAGLEECEEMGEADSVGLGSTESAIEPATCNYSGHSPALVQDGCFPTADVLLLSPSVLSDLRRSSDAVQADLESDIATLLSLRASPAFREARDEGLVEMMQGACMKLETFAILSQPSLSALAALAPLMCNVRASRPSLHVLSRLSIVVSHVLGRLGAVLISLTTRATVAGTSAAAEAAESDALEQSYAARTQVLALKRTAAMAAIRLTFAALVTPLEPILWGILLSVAALGVIGFTALICLAEGSHRTRGLPLGPAYRALSMLSMLSLSVAVSYVVASGGCAAAVAGCGAGVPVDIGTAAASTSSESKSGFGDWELGKFLRIALTQASLVSAGSVGFGPGFAVLHAVVTGSALEWAILKVRRCCSHPHTSSRLLSFFYVAGPFGDWTSASVVFRTCLTLSFWRFFEGRARNGFVRELYERGRLEREAKDSCPTAGPEAQDPAGTAEGAAASAAAGGAGGSTMEG